MTKLSIKENFDAKDKEIYRLRCKNKYLRKTIKEMQERMAYIAKYNCGKAALAKKALLHYSKKKEYW